MEKDRARPFALKHRRYWITVTGGMILIMTVNVGLGLWLYYDSKAPRGDGPPPPPPPSLVDAGVDAPPTP